MSKGPEGLGLFRKIKLSVHSMRFPWLALGYVLHMQNPPCVSALLRFIASPKLPLGFEMSLLF